MSNNLSDCYKTDSEGKRSIQIMTGKDGADVFVQSNTSDLFQVFLQTYEKEDITLTSNINMDDMQFNASPGHGISIGDSVIVYNSNYFSQKLVKAVDTNLITLYTPYSLPFNSSNTTVIRGNRNLNVEGTIETPIVYKFGIPSSLSRPIDINAGLILMGHTADSGDDKYGGISALTNGFLLRKENSIKFNLGNYKTNRDYKLYNGEVSPTPKPPAGTYGTDIKFKLQGQENFDQVIRLTYGDFIIAYVRDDLSDLLFKQVSLIGSFTEGE